VGRSATRFLDPLRIARPPGAVAGPKAPPIMDTAPGPPASTVIGSKRRFGNRR